MSNHNNPDKKDLSRSISVQQQAATNPDLPVSRTELTVDFSNKVMPSGRRIQTGVGIETTTYIGRRYDHTHHEVVSEVMTDIPYAHHVNFTGTTTPVRVTNSANNTGLHVAATHSGKAISSSVQLGVGILRQTVEAVPSAPSYKTYGSYVIRNTHHVETYEEFGPKIGRESIGEVAAKAAASIRLNETRILPSITFGAEHLHAKSGTINQQSLIMGKTLHAGTVDFSFSAGATRITSSGSGEFLGSGLSTTSPSIQIAAIIPLGCK